MGNDIKDLRNQIKECDPTKAYAFVSYSKKDAEYVYPVILELQKRGCNLWIDKELTGHVGENWQKNAISAIKNINCKCVLFFVSNNSMLSAPVFTEIIYTDSEALKSLKRRNTKIIPICTSDRWVPEIKGLSEWIDNDLLYSKEGMTPLEDREYKMLDTAGLEEKLWKHDTTRIETHGQLAAYIFDIYFAPNGGDNVTFAYYTDVEGTIMSNIPPEVCDSIDVSENESLEKHSQNKSSSENVVSQNKDETKEKNDTPVLLGNWGPEREVFSIKDKVDHVTFNSVIDNEEIGDERKFVRIGEVGSIEYKKEIIVVPGKAYEVVIYYYNNGNPELNEKGVSISRETKFYSSYPDSINKKRPGTIKGIITSANAEPKKIWDEVHISTFSDRDVFLDSVKGSVKHHNKYKKQINNLTEDIFSCNGVIVGLDDLHGFIPAGDEFAGLVTFTIIANTSYTYYMEGKKYRSGEGVEKDYVKAREYFEKSARKGNSYGHTYLAIMYANGEGVEKDYKKAAQYYNYAVLKNNPVAQRNLGLMYRIGQGVEKDYEKAKELFEKAAAQDNALALIDLGRMYMDGEGVEKDLTKAKVLFEKAADQGQSKGQYYLGNMYYWGKGVDRDYKKAMELFEKSAENGNTTAQNMLGYIYKTGIGAEQNYAKAKEIYEKLSEQGNPLAQYNLAIMYENGEGVEQDHIQAMQLYEKSAREGDADAQNNLGVMYMNGKSVDRDYIKAKDWFEKSAAQGNAQAQCNLGKLYYFGNGVTKDLSKAKEYFQMSADQGNMEAQKNLEVF